MVGAFQYFFIERHLFQESFLTIWIHGAMEISAIVIAGAAGFALGRSLLFPGTYSRAVSFRLGAVKAIKIFIGITPIIVIAGFLESYFTRHTGVPDLVRGCHYCCRVRLYGHLLFCLSCPQSQKRFLGKNSP
jgi:uncharacterized membrane protein SpoIIM required for sporulation